MAYTKLHLQETLLASTLPDDPWVARALFEYFPRKLREAYATYIERHPLRREIITTIWTEATDAVADAMERVLYPLNPINMMARSGARGSSRSTAKSSACHPGRRSATLTIASSS